MIITDVNIHKTFAAGRLMAIVSVILNGCIAINDIKIVRGNNRIYVAMPAFKDENGDFRDIIHPMCVDARAEFEEKILDAYENYIAHNGNVRNNSYSA